MAEGADGLREEPERIAFCEPDALRAVVDGEHPFFNCEGDELPPVLRCDGSYAGSLRIRCRTIQTFLRSPLFKEGNGRKQNVTAG